MGARLARHGPGTLPGHRGRRRLSPLALAGKALEMAKGSGDGALVRVTGERSLLLRFAGSRPTQATSLHDLTVEIAVLRDGKVGHGATTRTDSDGLAAAARAAAEAAAAGGAGAHPGLPA